MPRAKHTLGFGKFEYTAHQPLSAREDADPPFGRAVYFFENDRWIWID